MTLYRYVWLYNQALPKSVLASKTSVQAMKDWYKIKPELFKKQPYYLPECNRAEVPWQPDVASLNGNLSFKLTKGAIAQMGGGGVGQLLHFISFDALLRKLQLDFSDTFSDDFAFDAILDNTNIKMASYILIIFILMV